MDRYIQALSLEMFIMERLLERHRYSHGRAIYFRRISMIVQAARKHNLLQIGVHFQSLEHTTLEYCQRRKRKRNAEDPWDIQGRILTDEQRAIHEQFETVQSLLTDGFQELLSRIDHASTMLFLEVSRGFFLPFCTVALATLARTRTLLLRIGRIGLSKLQMLVSAEESLRNFLSMAKIHVETCMTRYLKEDQEPLMKGIENGRITTEERRASLVQSIGFTVAKKQSNSDELQAKELYTEMDNGTVVEFESNIPDDRTGAAVESVDIPPSKSFTDDNDIGESVDFSPSIDVTSSDVQSKVSASEACRVADPMDRNLEILETLKRDVQRESSHRKGMASSEKPPKKRKHEKKEKSKKKKKSSGDFFDSLFNGR
jgi:hypothetical protein